MATRDDSTEPGSTEPDERTFVGPGSDSTDDTGASAGTTAGAGSTATAERAAGGRGRRAVRTAGEVLITAGLVVLLFVVYELYVTDWFSAGKQNDANAALDNQWAGDRQLRTDLVDGKAFARLYIPSFGADYHFTVQEGVGEDSLEIGPGHYKGTALPGEPGNFAVAGHRVGKGAPFNDLDLLNSCDAIVVETAGDFFVYRVLPHADELANWATGKGRDPRCAGVSTLRTPGRAAADDPYGDTTGREVVTPDKVGAVAPVPYRDETAPGALPPSGRASLLTLTTCHPQFSDRERLISHSVLVKQFHKAPGASYAGLLKQIGEAS